MNKSVQIDMVVLLEEEDKAETDRDDYGGQLSKVSRPYCVDSMPS